MWNNHTIRGPRTERGRGGGVPNALFQDARAFEEDDALVAEIGVDMFAAEPGLQLHERREADATPPASHDPLQWDALPDISLFLQRVRDAAMAIADREHGFSNNPTLDAAKMEFQFFLHVTGELCRLADGTPGGARVWPSRAWVSSAAGSEFSAYYAVRQIIRAAAQRVNA